MGSACFDLIALSGRISPSGHDALAGGRAVAQSPHPLPAFSSDPLRPDRAQRASVLGNLDRSRLDDLRPAPLGNLASGRLAVVASETETRAPLEVAPKRRAAPAAAP